MVKSLRAQPAWGAIYKRRYVIAYILLGILAVFLRLYRLNGVPLGLHVDEVVTAYNAFCISEYGVTMDLVSLPVHAANFSGSQSVLYSYVLAMFFKIFGVHLTVIRLPGVLFSFVTIVSGALLIYKALGKKAALLGATFLTILPYFITSSRFGLDCYLLTGTTAAMLCLLVYALEYKRLWLFALTGLVAGMALYSYALSYLLLPIFFVLLVVYLFYTKAVKLKQLIALGIPLALLAFPLILFVIINQFGLSSIHIGPLTIPALSGYKVNELGTADMIGNIRKMFDTILFRDPLPYNAFNNYFTMFLPSIPFVLLGIGKGFVALYNSVKARTYCITSVMFLFFASNIIVGLFLWPDPPNVNKINSVYFSCAYFLVVGILQAYQTFRRSKVFVGILAALYLVNVVFFTNYYFNVYPETTYPQYLFYPAMNEVVEKLDEINTEGRTVHFTQDYHSLYYALATQTSPYDMRYDINGRGTNLDGKIYFGVWDIEKSSTEDIFVVWNADEWYVTYYDMIGFEKVYESRYIIYRWPQAQ